MGPPFLIDEWSDYCWSLALYWGVTLLVLTLIHSCHSPVQFIIVI
jgi:hypothetical protein